MAQAISKKEKTAVEWLIRNVNENIVPMYIPKQVVEQAKAMEKEQMLKCASFWGGKKNEIEKPIFEQWYNENYGGSKC